MVKEVSPPTTSVPGPLWLWCTALSLCMGGGKEKREGRRGREGRGAEGGGK